MPELATNNIAKKYLNPHELAEYTGFSIYTIYSWVRSRQIPYIKKSRLLRFDREEIDKWLKKDEVKSINEFMK